jgi:hypothetical protein
MAGTSHPDPLMFPALTAHAPTYIGGVRTVFQIVPAVCRERSLQLLGLFLVSPHT